MPDYESMTAAEAIRHAKEMSGLTAEEAAHHAGVSPAVMRRYLRTDDDYFPGLDMIPHLCAAFGNTVLLRWLEAQTGQEPGVTAPPAQSRAEVLTALARATATLGDAQRCLADSEDGGITPPVAREVRGLLQDLIADCRRAQEMLLAQAQSRGLVDIAPLASIRKGQPAGLWQRIKARYFT
jgi:transcriptional regulator with XRE-family HTH domain